jgi:hypothetical protein
MARAIPAVIPAEWAREYWAKGGEQHRWLVKTAVGLEVRDWRSEMVRWWRKDFSTWRSLGEKNAGSRRAERDVRLKKAASPEERRAVRLEYQELEEKP